jgi:hypothetical protein
MEDPSPEKQRADKAQADLDRRECLKSFALVLALILLTLAVAGGLARSVTTA